MIHPRVLPCTLCGQGRPRFLAVLRAGRYRRGRDKPNFGLKANATLGKKLAQTGDRILGWPSRASLRQRAILGPEKGASGLNWRLPDRDGDSCNSRSGGARWRPGPGRAGPPGPCAHRGRPGLLQDAGVPGRVVEGGLLPPGLGRQARATGRRVSVPGRYFEDGREVQEIPRSLILSSRPLDRAATIERARRPRRVGWRLRT
jgi:hypothetical protein